jgi:hypothetical protein
MLTTAGQVSKPDMQTPSVFPKRTPVLAKRAQSRWRRGVEERSTLTARASHIIEARGTLGFAAASSAFESMKLSLSLDHKATLEFGVQVAINAARH